MMPPHHIAHGMVELVATNSTMPCVCLVLPFHWIFRGIAVVVVRQVDTSTVGIIRQSHFVGSGNLAVIAKCFTCNILTERSIITFTQGKFKRRTICAFAPKWNFFVTRTINIIWTMWQKVKGRSAQLLNIKQCRYAHWFFVRRLNSIHLWNPSETIKW